MSNVFEAKKGNVHVLAAQTNKVGDIAVCLDIPCKCAHQTLKSLKSGTCCECAGDGVCCAPKGLEESAVCYALCLAIRQKLCGTPLDVSKSKVGNVCCGYHGGHFIICWKVQGTVSAVRKSIGMALSVLSPGKYYSTYAECMRQVKQKPDRNVFNYVADEITKQLKSEIMISVVGRIKLDKKKLDDMLSVLANKVDVRSVEGTKEKPTGHTECKAECCEIKCTGWGSALAKDYIQYKVKGLCIDCSNQGICINCKDSKWDTIAKKLKADLKEFINIKYGRVKEDLHPITAYMLSSSCSLCSHDLAKLLKEKPTMQQIESAINKCL